jgi:hypothetical protein
MPGAATVARALAAACLLTGALGLAACGGAGDGTRTQTRGETQAAADYFVGKADGIGASVDFAAADRVTRALTAAMSRDAGRPVVVGVAAILNDSSRAAPLPVLVGVLGDGATVPLTSGWEALAGRDDPAARRARALLPLPGPLAPDETTAVYLTLPRSRATRLAGVRMRTAAGSVADLDPQAR